MALTLDEFEAERDDGQPGAFEDIEITLEGSEPALVAGQYQLTVLFQQPGRGGATITAGPFTVNIQ